MRACLALFAAVILSSGPAWAHWCDDLWGSSYNLVVKPAADSVAVPSGSPATLDVFVQNNMGYPLKNFVLRVGAPATYTVTLSRDTPKVPSFLMPGENLRYTLSISKSGAAANLSSQSLNFYVDFGDGSQDQLYGGGTSGARHVVMRGTTGTLRPTRPIAVPGANGQAIHLEASAKADYQDLAGGLDDLVNEFCAGRGSWDANGGPPITTYCTGTATTCPARTTRGHTKQDYQHLWSSFELAYRKGSLGTRVGPLRDRLICATNDSSPSFTWFPYAMLGYLGDDPTSRAFFTGKIASGTADERAAAKAGLLLFGVPADYATYSADVTAALASSNAYVSCLAATTLGIIDDNDAAVTARLIPRAGWVEPDTGDNGLNFYAAHLLNLVAWSRRGWATDANYSGVVSFYSTTVDTTPPRAPGPTPAVACTSNATGGVRVTWPAVTLDESGGAESVQGYRVYSGAVTRPVAATRPATAGFDYDHVDPPTGVLTTLFMDFTGLPGTAPTFFAVTAVDSAGNASVYSAEVSCTPHLAPTAVINCTPLSGLAPLSVACDSSGSTDPNGAADIVTRAWTLDGAAQPNGTTYAPSFAVPGGHVVRLTVTDAAGLTSTATANISATSATNTPPTAQASGTPTSGAVPLAVTFSSSGTTDPDTGQTLSYSWDFGDGTAVSTLDNPSHTYTTVGTFDAWLTVTDTGTPPASSSAMVRITGTGNSAPDLSSAAALPQSGLAPLAVHFDGTGVTDPDGDTMSFTWSFGDGATSVTTRSADHTYTTAGTYTARLSVTDDGQPALASPATRDFTITVQAPGTQNRPPDCSAATVTPNAGTTPLTVTLDATGCVDPDGDTMTYTWRVPRTITTEDTFDTATSDVVVTRPGQTVIALHVRDSAAIPGEIDLTFPVNTVEGMPEPVVGSCGCAAGGVEAFAGLGLLAMLRARRRR